MFRFKEKPVTHYQTRLCLLIRNKKVETPINLLKAAAFYYYLEKREKKMKKITKIIPI